MPLPYIIRLRTEEALLPEFFLRLEMQSEVFSVQLEISLRDYLEEHRTESDFVEAGKIIERTCQVLS